MKDTKPSPRFTTIIHENAVRIHFISSQTISWPQCESEYDNSNRLQYSNLQPPTPTPRSIDKDVLCTVYYSSVTGVTAFQSSGLSQKKRET